MNDSDSATEAGLTGLRMLAIERTYGHVGSDRLIRAGVDALVAGVDSPSLAELAGLLRYEEPEAPGLFTRVIAELGLIPPLEEGAGLWELARWWAGQIVDGTLDPVRGADLIWSRAAADLGYPPELQGLVEGAINAMDWNEWFTVSMAEIRAGIVEAAREFVARPA
jgi:hypothetical protein